MTQADSPTWDAPRHQGAGLRPRVRQVAWGCVPIVSFTFLGFMPFLWLALIRRQARDWAVFAAYLAAVVAELVLISVGKPRSAAWAIAVVIFVLVAVTATVHALVAFRPAAGLPSWRDVHAIRATDKLARGAAKQREINERATAARAAMADHKKAQQADRTAARAASTEAKQARAAERAAARAAAAEAKPARTAERRAARAAAAEAKQARKREKAAQKAEMLEERRQRRAAARAAEYSAPRYGWVETRRTYRRKTIFGNRRSETIVSRPSERNARRRTRQRFGVTITEEWRRLD